ncbi:major capsid protein [Halomonas alimentaria]|uniref:Major capsid protein n=1 Tax=Halomonas alimentaria TaxID=147248 RepID=A0A7X4W616_9GAMM|nr:major capsid protein [Halomonas alimentaria]NAW35004.1 hypothetical protein [Halomonas alimentaria]
MSTQDVMSTFKTYVFRASGEALAQNVNAFNEASRGAIQLGAAQNVGDFSHQAAFAAVKNFVRRRDPYANTSVDPTPLEMLNETSVKVATGTSPVTFSPSHYRWIQENPEEAGVMLGEELAEAILQDQLNASIIAARAAITGNADAVYDGTANKLDLQALLQGAAKFGDQASQLVAWVCHSKPLHDLYSANVANNTQLFQFGTVNIQQDGFGRILVCSDSPALSYEDNGTFFTTLGLTQGGIKVEDNGDMDSHIETTTGRENLVRTFQAESSFNVGVRGYAYSGAKAPTDAELGTGASWTQVASDVKGTAGVAVNSK